MNEENDLDSSHRQLKAVGWWNAFRTNSHSGCIIVTPENVNGIHRFRTRSSLHNATNYIHDSSVTPRYSQNKFTEQRNASDHVSVIQRDSNSHAGFYSWLLYIRRHFMLTQFKHKYSPKCSGVNFTHKLFCAFTYTVGRWQWQ